MVIKNVDQATTKCSLENPFVESLDFHRLYNLWIQRLEKTFLRMRLVIPRSPEYQKAARRFQRSLQNQQQWQAFLLPQSPLILPCEQTHCLSLCRYSDRLVLSHLTGTRCKWTHQCQGGAVLGFIINASGPDKMTVQNLDTQHMAQKHIRLNSDVITFNKNTRWYFSALCTLRMSEHSGHYCIVMYKCKSMFLWQLYVQALLWLAKLPDEDPVPPGNWPKLHSSSLPLPSSPSQEEDADCWLPRRSRWIQLFLHCGAELNLTSSFLKINIILKKKKRRNQVAGGHGACYFKA